MFGGADNGGCGLSTGVDTFKSLCGRKTGSPVIRLEKAKTFLMKYEIMVSEECVYVVYLLARFA